MILSLIAAVGEHGELGKNNALLWRLPGDLPFFKRVTMGCPVVMGRKTFESLPRALPGRLNIVITKSRDYTAPGAVTAASPASALDLVPDAPEVFVIGGGQIYRAFLPLADRLYLTEAAAADPTADTWFPAFDPNDYTRTVLDENREGIPYRHVLYERKKGADANA